MITVKTNYIHHYDKESEELTIGRGDNLMTLYKPADSDFLEDLETWASAARLASKPQEEIKYLKNYEQVVDDLFKLEVGK